MNEGRNEPILRGIYQSNFTLCYRMTHRFRWPHSARQQYRRSYCATTEVQEYPEDYLSTAEYNSKNCWFKMDKRVQSDGVWCLGNRLRITGLWQQWNRGGVLICQGSSQHCRYLLVKAVNTSEHSQLISECWLLVWTHRLRHDKLKCIFRKWAEDIALKHDQWAQIEGVGDKKILKT